MQYPTKIPIFGLRQSVVVLRQVNVQYAMTTSLLVNLLVTTGLHVYGGGIPLQPPEKVNPHPQSSGGPLGDSFNRGLHRGVSFNQGPHGGPPPNPLVRLYGWPTLDLT